MPLPGDYAGPPLRRTRSSSWREDRCQPLRDVAETQNVGGVSVVKPAPTGPPTGDPPLGLCPLLGPMSKADKDYSMTNHTIKITGQNRWLLSH